MSVRLFCQYVIQWCHKFVSCINQSSLLSRAVNLCQSINTWNIIMLYFSHGHNWAQSLHQIKPDMTVGYRVFGIFHYKPMNPPHGHNCSESTSDLDWNDSLLKGCQHCNLEFCIKPTSSPHGCNCALCLQTWTEMTVC